MSEIRLHDTRTGEKVPLRPRNGRTVGIYACGPTVYSRVHVGNARPFVVFSLLRRFLAHEGYEPVLVANITDVNDKIYAAARERGIPSAQLAREMTAAYMADTEALGLGRPDHEPLAGDYIPQIVELIERLVERGHAYPAGGDVLFRVRSLPSYGSLSHRDVDQMDQGEGVEGAEHKQDPLDFALWKGEKPEEDLAWDSPWGRGRPGWHIECSAMAEDLLGLEFEVHGGGSDLVFPHHENEAAQTLAARGSELAQIWMHNGMLQLGDEKMAKSVGNIRGLAEVIEVVGRDTLIMFFCGAHYRQPMAFEDSVAGRRRGALPPLPRGRAQARGGRVTGGAGAHPRALLRRARRRLQHARGARRRARLDPRGQQGRPPRRRCRPARDAGRAGSREPARCRSRGAA